MKASDKMMVRVDGGGRMGRLFPGAMAIVVTAFDALTDLPLPGRRYIDKNGELRRCVEGPGGPFIPGKGVPAVGSGVEAIIARLEAVHCAE